MTAATAAGASGTARVGRLRAFADALARNLGIVGSAAPIATGAALGSFLSGHAAFIAQRTVLDYCRAKTGLFSYALFEEEAFKLAYDKCRWEGYAAVMGDLFLVAEGHLREDGTDGARIVEPLVALYRRHLTEKAPPDHRAQGWDDVLAAFESRLRLSVAARPKSPAESVSASAHQIFVNLPIHHIYSSRDEEVILGSVQFRALAMWQELQRRVDRAAVAADLLAMAGGAAARPAA
ncbi:MAG: hypothetical protein JNK11_18320 [Alphaproteobacteria bacterium]|nr:hypothetical protein [Alphaproteobacteria bacterium]